jgi:hypothetical protein
MKSLVSIRPYLSASSVDAWLHLREHVMLLIAKYQVLPKRSHRSYKEINAFPTCCESRIGGPGNPYLRIQSSSPTMSETFLKGAPMHYL